ncbi:MAG: UDP-N-acetylglucosamine 1-carboxyvinyltransferase [Acidobacteria bacterium]|nr:UDP-N-acetylglucosamine 1-carboxyvinyltransferase [Acidobacteriota bacterium]MBI3655335.1 UDP-N-acetylglucosamine 1-carboxyvinyltransferase [Acidobacteriota bacterium]
MDKLKIVGGKRLAGAVRVSGAKNAALPAMAAALLTEGPVTLHNVPEVKDVATFSQLLTGMGAKVVRAGKDTLKIDAAEISSPEAVYDLVRTMRASVLSLGPLIARFGRARVSLPGGCAIGPRPINLHLAGLEKLGARIAVEHGYVEAHIPYGSRLRGAEIEFPMVTVTGTENLMMAATLAEGETTLINAACEPEVVDLADLLRAMGSDIKGDGTKTIMIRRRNALGQVEHSVIPDRIEAGTLMIAAAVTKGDVEVNGCRPDHLQALIEKLRQAGVIVENVSSTSLRVHGTNQIHSVDVTTNPYPEFPTDMQAQYMVLMTQGEALATITETIFENRFMQALELMRMGADITIDGSHALVRGSRPLTGAAVTASDLRASAALVLAGLIAEGTTWINRVYHLDRGYEALENKFRGLGADIDRVR